MAVNTHDLTNPVLQAIESWTSVQNHDLGYGTSDQSTGHDYRYVKLADTAFLPAAGQPVGWNGANSGAEGTLTLNEISGDADKIAQCGPAVAGICRGTTSSTNIYGFIEERKAGQCTTVLSSYVSAIAVADPIVWTSDGYLNSEAGAAMDSDDKLLCAYAIDSHGSSKDQADASVTTITPLGIVWI